MGSGGGSARFRPLSPCRLSRVTLMSLYIHTKSQNSFPLYIATTLQLNSKQKFYSISFRNLLFKIKCKYFSLLYHLTWEKNFQLESKCNRHFRAKKITTYFSNRIFLQSISFQLAIVFQLPKSRTIRNNLFVTCGHSQSEKVPWLNRWWSLIWEKAFVISQ